MPRPRQAALALAAILVVSSAALSSERDPIALLKASAAAVQAAPSASVDLVVSTRLVRGEQVDEVATDFAYRTAPEGRFEFITVDPNAAEEGAQPKFGYWVAGNDKVTMTAFLSQKRHMLEEDNNGFAAFAGSPAASGIGSGLGGLALSFLHPAAAEELVKNILQSELIGEEEVDGEKLLHARYVVGGNITTDVWFTAGDEPLVRRVKPDLLKTPSVQAMAQRHETFDYQLSFDFNNWSTNAGLTAADLAVTEPQSSLLMASLYGPPAPRPHPLLGKTAPAFTLSSAGGEPVKLEEKFGEEVVLLEFWQTTCPICVKAMPELEKLEEAYAERGVGYYAVNVGETSEEVAAFLKTQDLAPTALLDEDAEMADAYDVGAIPLILLVGRDGKVQAASEGFMPGSPAKLAAQIESALEGKDLAQQQLDAQQAAEDQRAIERKRLKSLLDG